MSPAMPIHAHLTPCTKGRRAYPRRDPSPTRPRHPATLSSPPPVAGPRDDVGGDGSREDEKDPDQEYPVDDLRVARDDRGSEQGDHAQDPRLAGREQPGVGVWEPHHPVDSHRRATSGMEKVP